MIPPHIQELLARLHAESATQEAGIPFDHARGLYRQHASGDAHALGQIDDLYREKAIALDEDKARFVYHLLVAKGATTVVEAGTSFGISTVYLALAVAAAAAAAAPATAPEGTTSTASRPPLQPKVIATEKEPSKAARARDNWRLCGADVERCIDLRIGDLAETLAGENLGLEENRHVDALLLDIWPYVALPALNLVKHKMRPGSVVVVDNVISSAEGYAELLEVLRDPKGPWSSVTLPYKGGLELSVYMG